MRFVSCCCRHCRFKSIKLYIVTDQVFCTCLCVPLHWYIACTFGYAYSATLARLQHGSFVFLQGVMLKALFTRIAQLNQQLT